MKKIYFSSALLAIVLILTSFIINPEKEALKSGSKYDCIPTYFVSVSAIQSGLWNEASTWSNNQVPSASDDVMIPSGIRVALSGNSQARTISVDGILSIQNLTSNFDLTTKGIMINDGGLFQF